MTDLTLYLLRHGESDANVARMFSSRKLNPPLSETGIQQARRQAESLKVVGFEAIYASSLLRARQTAGIVGEPCGLQPIHTDELWEIYEGILDGESQTDPQHWATYEGVLQKWEQGRTDVSFPGGESLNDIGARFSRFLDELERKEHRCVLVVGHCLLFMGVIWLFCENHGPTLEDGHMGRGHLSIIRKTGDRFRLLKFNISPEASVQEISLMSQSGSSPTS